MPVRVPFRERIGGRLIGHVRLSRSGYRTSVHVAVLARTDVALGVQRIAAQRARRAAGRDDLGRARDESARGRRRELHPQQVGPPSSSRVVVFVGRILVRRPHALRRRAPRVSPSHVSVIVPTRNASMTGSSRPRVATSDRIRSAGRRRAARPPPSARPAARASTATCAFSSATVTTRRPCAACR